MNCPDHPFLLIKRRTFPAAVAILLALLIGSCISNPPSIEQDLQPGPSGVSANTQSPDIDRDPLLAFSEIESFLPPILERITVDNASRLQQFGQLGYGAISDLAWSPAGELLAVSTAAGVYLYDVETLEQRVVMYTESWQTSIDYSNDGSMLASGGKDGIIRIWEAATGDLLRSITASNSEIAQVAFTPNGERVISLRQSGTELRVWETASGRRAMTISGGELPGGSFAPRVEINEFAVSPDGGLIAALTDRSLRIWNLDTGMLRATVGPYGGETLAFSPDGELLATEGALGSVTVRHAGTGQPLRAFQSDGISVEVLRFSPDGRFLASYGSDGPIRLWDLETREVSSSMDLYSGYKYGYFVHSTMEFGESDDGWQLAATYGGMGRIWAAGQAEATASLNGHLEQIWAISPLPDQESLIVVGLAPVAWDLGSGQVARTLEVASGLPRSFALSDDVSQLYLGNSDGRVFIWDLSESSGPAIVHAHADSVTALAVHPDGHLFASGGDDNRVRVWDLGVADPRFELLAQEEAVDALYFGSDGNSLGSLGRVPGFPGSSTIWIWDPNSGERLNTLDNEEDWSLAKTVPLYLALTRSDFSLEASAPSTRLVIDTNWRTVHTFEGGNPAFNADGGFVSTSDDSGKVWVWDILSGELIHGWQPHQATPFALPVMALSSDGSILASSGGELPALALWDPESGANLADISAPRAKITLMVFSNDDRLLFTAGADGIVRIWGVAPSKLSD